MTRRGVQRVGATSFRRWMLRAAGVTLASAGAVCMSASVASADDKDGPLSPLTSTVEKATTSAVGPVVETVAPASQKAAEPVAKVTEKVAEPVEKVAEPVEKVAEKVAEPVEKPVEKVADEVVEPVAEPVQKVVEPVTDAVEPVTDAVEPVATPVAEAAEPVLTPVADTLKPASDAVEGLVTPLVPVAEPIVDVVAPVMGDVAEETVLSPIGMLLPGSGDAGPVTAPPPAGQPPSSGATTPDEAAAAPLEDAVAGPMGASGPVSGLPAPTPDQATTRSLHALSTALAGGGVPLGIAPAGATSGAPAVGDTVALLADLPIHSAGTWLLPAADAFSSLPHPAFEIPVSPA